MTQSTADILVAETLRQMIRMKSKKGILKLRKALADGSKSSLLKRLAEN